MFPMPGSSSNLGPKPTKHHPWQKRQVSHHGEQKRQADEQADVEGAEECRRGQRHESPAEDEAGHHDGLAGGEETTLDGSRKGSALG